MRTNWQTYPINFTGGLVSNLGLLEHGLNAPGSAKKLVNFEPSTEGGYRKIAGFSRWTVEPVPGIGVVRGVVLADANLVIAVRGNNYYLSVSKGVWNSGFTSDEVGGRVRYADFNYDGTEKVVMVDGVNNPIVFNTSTLAFTEITSSIDVLGATHVVEFKGRMFYARGNTLVYTGPFDEADFTPVNGAGVINVGSRITGMIVFREHIIVFSEDRIQRITGSSELDYQLSPITQRTGCTYGDSIMEVGGDIIYRGPDGIRFLSASEKNDDFGLERASEAIQNLVVASTPPEDMVVATVVREKSQYRIFTYQATASPTSNRGWLGTRFLDQQGSGIQWADMLGFKVYSCDSRQFPEGEFILFGNDTNYIYQMESGSSFDSLPIYCEYQTPFMPIEDDNIRKTFYKHHIYTQVGGAFSLECQMLLDYDQANTIQPEPFILFEGSDSLSLYGEAIYGVSTYGGEFRTKYTSNIVGSGFSVSFLYRDNSTNPSFSLNSLTLELRFNDRK